MENKEPEDLFTNVGFVMFVIPLGLYELLALTAWSMNGPLASPVPYLVIGLIMAIATAWTFSSQERKITSEIEAVQVEK